MDIDHTKNYLNDREAHKCNTCEYTSSQQDHLRTHLKTHSGEKPNNCNQCDYASCRADSLRRHLKTHGGEKAKLRCHIYVESVESFEYRNITYSKGSVDENLRR